MIATVDEQGRAGEFTSGSTAEELRQVAAWPDCPRLVEHFRDLAAPLRLAVGHEVSVLAEIPIA